MASPLTTRAKAVLLVAAFFSIPASSARCEDPAIPLQLQVDLTAKLIEYAQAPSPQGLSVLRIGILAKGTSVESLHFASELKASFGRIAQIAGLAHEEVIINWSTASALVEEVKRRGLFAVYLTPGLSAEMSIISRALEGAPIVTVGALDSYVTAGAILGFELVSGRPKMVLNLVQAKKQGVAFRATVMRLMRIVE
jgi:hypothetical protein